MPDRTVLITGAARRVGAAIARILAADGWNVIVHYNRSRPEAEQLARRHSRGAAACAISSRPIWRRRADVESLMQRCVALAWLASNA